MAEENDDDGPLVYEVRVSEPAEAEIDAIYLSRLAYGMEAARRWHTGLLESLERLAVFPRAHPFAPERATLGGEVRQILYGKGRNVYRLLYRIVDPQGDNPGIVRVIHVRHAAQRWLGQEQE